MYQRLRRRPRTPWLSLDQPIRSRSKLLEAIAPVAIGNDALLDGKAKIVGAPEPNDHAANPRLASVPAAVMIFVDIDPAAQLRAE